MSDSNSKSESAFEAWMLDKKWALDQLETFPREGVRKLFWAAWTSGEAHFANSIRLPSTTSLLPARRHTLKWPFATGLLLGMSLGMWLLKLIGLIGCQP